MRKPLRRFIVAMSILIGAASVVAMPSAAQASYPCPSFYSYCWFDCPGTLQEACTPEACFGSFECEANMPDCTDPETTLVICVGT